MNQVVITGCTGFFGGALTRTLLSRGVKVYGVDLSEEKLGRFRAYDLFTPVIAEFGEYERLPEMIRDPDIDVFYHLAWAGGFTTAIRNYKLQMMNAAYAGDALTAARKMNAGKFVYANTYNQYEIEVISPKSTNTIADQILDHFDHSSFDRRFVSDNLYHDVVTLYF